MADGHTVCECGHIGSRHGHERQSCAAVGCDCQHYRRHPYAEAIATAEAIAEHQDRMSRLGCPTPCDDDCTATCHEGHQPRWKRDHQPENCMRPLVERINP